MLHPCKLTGLNVHLILITNPFDFHQKIALTHRMIQVAFPGIDLNQHKIQAPSKYNDSNQRMTQENHLILNHLMNQF